jgi:putative ABC transport system permease protein
MIAPRLLMNLKIAYRAVLGNTVRSALTALGIIFGVAAVITMLAIGKGAQLEILKQIELVGVNNIEIKPVIEQKEEAVEENNSAKEEKSFSKGLDLKDAQSIAKVLPTVARVSPEIIIETAIIKSGRRRSAKLIGVNPAFFSMANLKMRSGQMFGAKHIQNAESVCIIGNGIKKKLFTNEDALGKRLKVGQQWLTVIGITKAINVTEKAQTNLGIRDYNMDIYAPISTVLVRYKNRAKLKADLSPNEEEENTTKAPVNLNQIDRLVVQVTESNFLGSTAEVISRMLKRKHNGVVDFEIVIPQQLLEQQQRTKDIFNLVLSAIAGISLLVGGIGIMNIMLASVMERTREIGTRLAIGAKKQDIINQFLLEALLISLSGGLIGVLLGLLAAFLVEELAQIETVVTAFSILISFGVASITGLIFGLSPARKAALKNPVESLRYE